MIALKKTTQVYSSIILIYILSSQKTNKLVYKWGWEPLMLQLCSLTIQ